MAGFECRDGDLNLKLVRAFLATEATGSFVQAARNLCISESALSGLQCQTVADIQATASKDLPVLGCVPNPT
jgi:hypothetical protein